MDGRLFPGARSGFRHARFVCLLAGLVCFCTGSIAQPLATPAKLLAEAEEAYKENRDNYFKTGNLAGVGRILGPVREKAQAAYAQFLGRKDYAKAAESLVTLANIDRALIAQHPSDMQVRQEPVKREYAEALQLAEQAHDAAVQYKALKGLAQANLNSKDYMAAADQIIKAIELATQRGNKDDLFDAYERRSELELARGNLSAASDYLDRALAMSGEIKDHSLLAFAYGSRADLYDARVAQCDVGRSFDFCKKVFDSGIDDLRQAIQLFERLGFDYLKNHYSATLAARKALGGEMAKTVEFEKLLGQDRRIMKASQVLIEPRFAFGADAGMAATARKAANLMGGLKNPYNPMEPYTEGQIEEWEGNDNGALQNYLQAVKLLENDRRKLGDVEGSGSYMSGRIEIYYAPALQYLDRKQYSRAFELIERSRARAIAELLASRELTFRTPELQDLFSQTVALRAQIGKAQNNLFDAIGSNKADSAQIKRPTGKGRHASEPGPRSRGENPTEGAETGGEFGRPTSRFPRCGAGDCPAGELRPAILSLAQKRHPRLAYQR
jgi:tetratricopeptide (TPR) repeat protein